MTSFVLKIIAIISMTIDHLAKIIGQSGLIELFPNMPLKTSFFIINLMEAIGRIAFPLFAFMIVEGVLKTSNKVKYFGRLSLFAVISEPFFYYAFNMQTASVSGFWANLSKLHFTNVFFTLALSVGAILIYEKLKDRRPKTVLLLFAPILLAFILFAGYAKCDYGMAGIILIFALYMAKTKRLKAIVLVIWSVGLYLLGQSFNGLGFAWTQITGFSIANCLCAILPCALIALYNGKRGKPLKWSFYVYYPAHLLVFSVISKLL